MSNLFRRYSISLAILLFTVVERSVAQVPDVARARSLSGCWAITVGAFQGKMTDSGQIKLPTMVSLDSLPGKDIYGDTMGWRMRGLPLDNKTRYHDGWFTVMGKDSVSLAWSGVFDELKINAVLTSGEMRGIATADTDVLGSERRAPITLRRVVCPA